MRLLISALISLAALLLAWNMAIADGIYVTKDKRHAAGDHIVIKLTNDQVIDVEANRNLILTEEQHLVLTKMNLKFPRKLEILSSRWDDCTCGIAAYAIWCRVGEVDIPTHVIRHFDNAEVNDENEENGTKVLKAIMDSKGKMFVNGKMQTKKEIEALAVSLEKTFTSAQKMQTYITVDTPPPISEEVDHEIFKTLRELESFAMHNNVSFYAIGYHSQSNDD